MWSSGVVLIVELFVCLQRAQGYPKTGTMDQYLQTRPVPPLHCRASHAFHRQIFSLLAWMLAFTREAPLGTHQCNVLDYAVNRAIAHNHIQLIVFLGLRERSVLSGRAHENILIPSLVNSPI